MADPLGGTMPRLCSSLLLSLLITSSASGVTMDWTPIGDPGNPTDPDPDTVHCGSSGAPCGAVGYGYSIGTYEVTNAQYTEFLNAKAASDPLGLYTTNMGDPGASNNGYGGITRSGSDGTYTYSAIAGRENMPVNWVSWYDALRFANWMNNGQGNGDTETGAYTLLGGTPQPSNSDIVTRNPGATILLASENEWYKAAYYDASSASYFAYPAGSNPQTTCASPTATANRANCLTGGGGDLTPVGSYTGSASPYGTSDQGGNVWEWTDVNNGSFSRFRGGSFDGSSFNLSASTGLAGGSPSASSNNRGFRLVMIPEPSTGLLVLGGVLALVGWRRVQQSMA
jgi:formylglycine-generating enzyme required for sulfatase activity